MHHDVALQRVSGNAPLPASHAVGLYHIAFEVPDKRTFAETYRTLTRAGVPVVTTDHCISWAMYFSDPSGNGVEVYCDTRNEPDGAALWEGADRPLDERKILDALTTLSRICRAVQPTNALWEGELHDDKTNEKA